MRKDDEGTWQCFCCRRRCHVRVEGVAVGVTGIAPPTPIPFPFHANTRTFEHLCLCVCVCVQARAK